MKVVLALVALVAATAALVEPDLDYHYTVGIPKAAQIKATERASDFDGSRIIGGQAAAVGSNPFLVGIIALLTTGRESTCGGSIMSARHTMTAAHCWLSRTALAREFELVFGSARLFSGGIRTVTRQVELHGNYNAGTLANDVAVVTHVHIFFSNNIQPIALPTATSLVINSFIGVVARAAGFGWTNNWSGNGTKNQVLLTVISNTVCANTFGNSIISSTLCTSGAGAVGTCRGDSGGPLSILHNGQRVLIGIASFTAENCLGSFPSGFARVTSFWPWILARI